MDFGGDNFRFDTISAKSLVGAGGVPQMYLCVSIGESLEGPSDGARESGGEVSAVAAVETVLGLSAAAGTGPAEKSCDTEGPATASPHIEAREGTGGLGLDFGGCFGFDFLCMKIGGGLRGLMGSLASAWVWGFLQKRLM